VKETALSSARDDKRPKSLAASCAQGGAPPHTGADLVSVTTL